MENNGIVHSPGPRYNRAMVKNDGPGSRSMPMLLRVLAGIAFILVLIIAAGTVYALAGRSSGSVRSSPPPAAEQGQTAPAGESIFTGIGRIRTNTSGARAAVIADIAFPYYPEDIAFSEELVSRIGDFRRETEQYFSSYPADELRMMDESALKADLLGRYNKLLRLGRIERLYFNDFMIVD
ncbi:flagellar basal body protein FliL [Treponema sp. OttesenSCG-928-L16]|nr:flagellar basal body protein FliL [Treponema sp. OttesenSCG-928-L16]